MKYKYDLKYFILRCNTLILYREALKFTSKLPDQNTKIELNQFIRYEFEKNRNITDQKKIEYLLADARKRINQFKETYNMSK
jgi:hypothetical protein